jgi:peptidyl-prolyl cis-trans isomerase D
MSVSTPYPQKPYFCHPFKKPTFYHPIMSIIQKIREKGALVSAIIIALALLGFIAMDYLSSRSMFGPAASNTVGRVNGEKISYENFIKSVNMMEQRMQSEGYPPGESTSQQAIETAWNQEVQRIIINSEIEKLGISVSEKELSNSILFGNNPPQDLKTQFSDETGAYNAQLASQQINATLKNGTPEQKAGLSAYIKSLRFSRMAEKYTSLLVNSINYPKWLLEKQNADNSLMATVSVVRKPYTEIADSTVKVTDDEIEAYVAKHEDDFKQEESRSISYVTFSAAPSSADSAEVREKMIALKDQMLNATDIQTFLAGEGAQNTFYDSYINGETIQIPGKDSIFKIPVGTVYGPYIDGNGYSIAKLLGVRQIPDTVKVRHILISTNSTDPQTGQPVVVRDTATAKALADSVMRIIAAGQNFDSVAAKVSEDPGSKDKGGIYEVGSGTMVPEFNDFMFTRPVGAKDVVKTAFGYHYMEVMSAKGSKTGYKIAYLSKPVLTSNETDQSAHNEASQFAAKSRDEKTFNENFEKELKPRGINKGLATDIGPSSSRIMGLDVSRQLVKKIYEAKRGEVIQPEKVGSDYVVAVVTEVFEEGTMGAERARTRVEPLLRNKKKAEMIKKQLGAISSLEAVATAWGKQVETVDSLRMVGSRNSVISYEPKVIGAAFNPNNRGKVVPEVIEGSQGAYVLRVDNVAATAVADANVAEQRKTRYDQAFNRYQQMVMMANQGQGQDPILSVLKEAATIKDNRSKHF